MFYKKSSVGKYAVPLFMLLLGNEVISLIALTVLAGTFLASIVNEAGKRGI